jgi:hypothetical protein
MRIHLFAAASLSLFAACTDMSAEEEEGTSARPDVISNAHLPTRMQLQQTEAAQSCQPREHLATSSELMQVLGQCVSTHFGFQCHPLDGDSLSQLKGLSLDGVGVWSSTVCARGDHSPGFYVANLDTGEVTCQSPQSFAQPICLHQI